MARSFVVSALLTTGAVAAVPAPASATIRSFRSPTGKLGCAFVSDSHIPRMVRCDWKGGGDHAVTLEEAGKGRQIHVSDTVMDPDAKVLAYGKSTAFGRLTCTSRTTGITCRSAHHGFTVSTERRRVF
jgi:hypothetical protein